LTVIVVKSPEAVPAVPEKFGVVSFVELPFAGAARVIVGASVSRVPSR
jgi:hypothetical protein